MCSVHALTAIMREYPLTPDDRAFCRALLQQGEVLAVMLDYVPESLVWLVATSGQAWLLRERQPGVVALSLHEVADFAGAIGDAKPASVWEAALLFASAAPTDPARPLGDSEGDPGGDGGEREGGEDLPI